MSITIAEAVHEVTWRSLALPAIFEAIDEPPERFSEDSNRYKTERESRQKQWLEHKTQLEHAFREAIRRVPRDPAVDWARRLHAKLRELRAFLAVDCDWRCRMADLPRIAGIVNIIKELSPCGRENDRKPRGRPRDTDEKQDERIYDAWATGAYPTFEELGRAFSMTASDADLAKRRHAGRIRRKRK